MDLGQKATEKILKSLEKELLKLYTSCYKKNKAEFEKAFNKLMKNKNISAVEQNKILSEMERYESILIQLSDEIKNANVTASKMINGEMINVYSENYNYGAYLVENASAANCGYNVYNVDSIKKLLADNVNPFTMISLDESKDRDIIYRLLKRQFTAAIINGESIEDIAKRVKATTEKSMDDSIRIARTETTRIQSLGRQESFKYGESLGLQLKKKWLSTGDNRTRERHLSMMNETVGLDESFSNGLQFPGDIGGDASEVINCRCTHIVEFEGIEKSAKEIELDNKLKDMSYNEWLRRQQENNKIKVNKNTNSTEKAVTKANTSNKTTAKQTTTQTTKAAKEETTKLQTYTAKELNNMTVKQLKTIAGKYAKEYYPNSGINFGNKSIEEAINELLKQDRSKTSLVKDIKSMQKGLKL